MQVEKLAAPGAMANVFKYSEISAIFLLLLFLLAWSFSNAAAAAPAPAPGKDSDGDDDNENEDPAQEQWVWCVENSESLELCKQMQTLLDQIDPEKEHTHTCKLGGEEDSCMKMIRDGDARLGIFDGGEIWEAHEEYGLIPIRTEVTDKELGRYYGVGVVKADNCPKSLSDMRGWKSCHTGYGRASGWVLPVTYFIGNGIMPLVSMDPNKSNDIESVEAFFSKSCAAGDDPKKEICSACKTTTNCNEDDIYYDYPGSFRCLVEGSGDVSFTKGIIAGLYAKGGELEQNDWQNLQDASQYKILCPNNTNGELCSDVTNYKNCNFGSAPGHTIMVSKNFSLNEINEFNKVMDAANNNNSYISLFSGQNLTDNEFAAGVSRSVRYNNTVQNLLGSLYQNIQSLESINSKATSDTSNAMKLMVPMRERVYGGMLVIGLLSAQFVFHHM